MNQPVSRCPPGLATVLTGRQYYFSNVGTSATAATGFDGQTLRSVYARLTPLAIKAMPLAETPPRKTRSPLILSRVHWVRPELVAEVTYLTWADDGLLRHTVFVGLREDKPAKDVRRDVLH
jgi:ATP-dependent DNA ligase